MIFLGTWDWGIKNPEFTATDASFNLEHEDDYKYLEGYNLENLVESEGILNCPQLHPYFPWELEIPDLHTRLDRKRAADLMSSFPVPLKRRRIENIPTFNAQQEPITSEGLSKLVNGSFQGGSSRKTWCFHLMSGDHKEYRLISDAETSSIHKEFKQCVEQYGAKNKIDRKHAIAAIASFPECSLSANTLQSICCSTTHGRYPNGRCMSLEALQILKNLSRILRN